jgi:hypothetical protein
MIHQTATNWVMAAITEIATQTTSKNVSNDTVQKT